ncbi:MAG: N(4)-(beta-N-acetylglucosaminyl)-L-asparaginase [Ectothiorhodospiraceae bacterium]|nr:N(4)-(beta-N-acetylglucosaminyl)-L-asparaginase [Chromatiales bacterium]MCP5156904.1 N(4)-(beta-N-acetylglucosaminyl)-L-asparaginase [Ectothiorhodospiraceae bacterium]
MIYVANSEATPGAETTVRALVDGASGLDAIEAGIRLVEKDPSIRSVGYNSWPNLLGDLELDAAMMDGDTLRTGAVGALRGFLHPVSVARAVMERLPHELLVGEGAARFAAEIGAEAAVNETEDCRAAWRRMLEANASPEQLADWPSGPLAELSMRAADPEVGRDTTVFLTHDRAGSIAAGVSTSGWAWKYPGRLGDSPLIGAGCYADTAFGAAACTGTGEMTIRASTARSVVLYMKTGMTVEEAVMEAVDDLRRLRGGLLFGVQIHAIDPHGGHKVVYAYQPKMEESLARRAASARHWFWREGMAGPELRDSERVRL